MKAVYFKLLTYKSVFLDSALTFNHECLCILWMSLKLLLGTDETLE